MDSLCNIEVKSDHLASSKSLFSQERSVHAAVVLQTKRQEKIFLIGGFGNSSRTGEIVKGLHKLENNIHTACSWKITLILLIMIMFNFRWDTADSSK